MVRLRGSFSLYTMLEGPRLHKMAFPTPVVWPLDESQGSSLLQGHGSWLMCEVALNLSLAECAQRQNCIMQPPVERPMCSNKVHKLQTKVIYLQAWDVDRMLVSDDRHHNCSRKLWKKAIHVSHSVLKKKKKTHTVRRESGIYTSNLSRQGSLKQWRYNSFVQGRSTFLTLFTKTRSAILPNCEKVEGKSIRPS